MKKLKVDDESFSHSARTLSRIDLLLEKYVGLHCDITGSSPASYICRSQEVNPPCAYLTKVSGAYRWVRAEGTDDQIKKAFSAP